MALEADCGVSTVLGAVRVTRAVGFLVPGEFLATYPMRNFVLWGRRLACRAGGRIWVNLGDLWASLSGLAAA